MIRIFRGEEPAQLSMVRESQLARLRSLARAPTSNDVEGYRIVAEELWRRQHYKCCYCENRVTKSYNDVEHYRPKASADRSPGSLLKHGYWWLAFNWDNLLYACPLCNRTAKNDRFPLGESSVPLHPEQSHPGSESPLLIDPASQNPIVHIEFIRASLGSAPSPKHWWAQPRNGSRLGAFTIEICGLNNAELRELREIHYENVVVPHVEQLRNLLKPEFDATAFAVEFRRALGLLNPKSYLVAFTYDALRASIPNDILWEAAKSEWPEPEQICSSE